MAQGMRRRHVVSLPVSSALLVVEHLGQIEATLVNGSSGKTASMVFSDLPMMVSATALPMHLATIRGEGFATSSATEVSPSLLGRGEGKFHEDF
ncbi:MAG: hypothetical protein ERJ67_04455 [Aphanocapsa feldmannii 277cV]|uniref:Uncharacterized protein n=1 Tax=Aphanocapsa feldmannii 277cV TaxID=2507553 RepID=A0A524RNU3_9CHRO|nr:MAG: hypothetical protein ERJ67_04455 [Aphanocapsa feldmannii 277cV]